MIFDITNLNIETLVRALVLYARGSDKPTIALVRREIAKVNNELIDSISNQELNDSVLKKLTGVNQITEKDGFCVLIDYYKGKPIKLQLKRDKFGRLLAFTFDYDYSNGRFQFLRVMLDFFELEEIIITQKSYSDHEDLRFSHDEKNEIFILNMKHILKSYTKRVEDPKNSKLKHWTFDNSTFNLLDYHESILKNLEN